MPSKEQAENIKKQIFQQIDSTFPEDKRDAAKKEIDSMNSEELEEFMEMNSKKSGGQSKCIFCSIVFGDIESYKIGENEDAVAVLEINPISKGHVLIIPKAHIQSKKEMSGKVLELVDNISERIKKNFSPKKISLEEKEMFGHFLIDLIPEYENEKRGEKKQAKKEELMELTKMFLAEEKKKAKKTSAKPKSKKIKEKLWLPQRIP
ncbi:MAG: HIT domain-containing protein [Nanoarchaeota archaeon]